MPSTEVSVRLPTLHQDQANAYNTPGELIAIRCGRRWGKCLASGTRIAMADGSYKAVEDVAYGDHVFALDSRGKIVNRKVLGVFPNGIKETITIETAQYRLRCTPNHPILTNGKWTFAQDIKINDLVATPSALPVGGNRILADKNKLDLLAIWLAEGKEYIISNTTKEILDIVKESIRPWGLELVSKNGIDWRMMDRSARTNRPKNGARVWLEKQGLWNKNSKTKFIPDWVYALDLPQLARFINLFFACDGSISKRVKNIWAIEIGLANEHMVRQIAELLLKFGILGQIRKKVHKKKNKHGEFFVSWRFISSESVSVEKFCTFIGAVSKESQIESALAAARASSGTCNKYYPIKYEQIDAVLPIKRTKNLLGAMRSWRKQSRDRITTKRFRLISSFIPNGAASLVLNSHIAWEEIKEVYQSGKTDTWDLSIEEDHNFFAGGICTHNTAAGVTIASDAVIRGEEVGWFAPAYKYSAESYMELTRILQPVITHKSHVEVIRTRGGGHIDFWTLSSNPLAGRGRRYHKIFIDEAAFTDDNTMMETWERAIEPTLFDYGGTAFAMSNTNGINLKNFFYLICTQAKFRFRSYHAPTFNNPFLPLRRKGETDEEHALRRLRRFERLKAETDPRVFQQEYLADFVDWSGASFFAKESLLVNGEPVAWPQNVDIVFATIDSATKTGKLNDGTAVVYWGLNVRKGVPYPLTILDWDIAQIEGALLETWLPTVFRNLEDMARACSARRGVAGAWIEDKSSGMILLQQAISRGWNAHPIDSKLTSVGKSERAISASGYVYQGKVKISKQAYDRVKIYKKISRNHLLGQIIDFRIGTKNDPNSEDDALDAFCYGVAIGLGNAEGF